MRLGIGTKGLVIIIVPFIFQIGFVVTLATNLKQAEIAAHESARARMISGYTSALVNLAATNTTVAAGYAMSKNKRYRVYYNNTLEDVQILMSRIGKLLVHPLEKRDFTMLQYQVKQLTDFSTKMVELTDDNKADEALSKIKDQSTDELWARAKQAGMFLVEHEDVATSRVDAMLQTARSTLSNIFITGVAIDSVLMLTMIVFFSVDITRRLSVMMENARLFAASQPLKARVKGSDQISQLDSVFHSMAETVRASERELRENEARLRAILENMLVGIFVTDETGLIEMVNQRTLEMFGCSEGDLKGLFVGQFLGAQSQKTTSLADYSAHILESAKNRISELDARRANGEVFPVEVTTSEFVVAEGKRLLTNVLDVSERKEIEKVRREFVSIVSHDLRAPLSGIVGGLNLLSEGVCGELPARATEIVKVADRSASRLMSLINDLLDIEKLEAGMMQISESNANVRDLIDYAVSDVARLADKSNIEIVIDAEDHCVSADRDRIIRVLVNLLSNAIKFSPENSEVKVDAHKYESEVEISITDQGRGISDQFKPLLFQKFQQSEKSDATKKGGTGLGLAICKAIVEQHGGSIGVESAEGKGSRFWFRLRAPV